VCLVIYCWVLIAYVGCLYLVVACFAVVRFEWVWYSRFSGVFRVLRGICWVFWWFLWYSVYFSAFWGVLRVVDVFFCIFRGVWGWCNMGFLLFWGVFLVFLSLVFLSGFVLGWCYLVLLGCFSGFKRFWVV